MKLRDVIDRLSEFSTEDTIYAVEPWAEQSEAIVAREPDTGGLPSQASKTGMKYFLEISIAQEFIEDWFASLDEQPAPSTVCQRLIDYASNDA